MINLKYRAWTRVVGDLTVIGTWMKTDDNQHRAVMCIIRTGEEQSEHTSPCVVTADKAWIWSEQIGDPRQSAHITASFLKALRIDITMRNAIRLTSIIHDHLGDLLSIPPFSTLGVDTAVVADVTRIDMETGEIHETEVNDYV